MADRWDDNDRRCDGLAVVDGVDGLVIMPAAERLPVDKCPVCDTPFPNTNRGRRRARQAADMLFPFTSEQTDGGS